MTGSCLEVSPRIWAILIGKSSSFGRGNDIRPWVTASSLLGSLMITPAVRLARRHASPPALHEHGGVGLEQPGYTRGSRGCHAHYHIIMLPGVWDWIFAIRLLRHFHPSDILGNFDCSFIKEEASVVCWICCGLSGWTFSFHISLEHKICSVLKLLSMSSK